MRKKGATVRVNVDKKVLVGWKKKTIDVVFFLTLASVFCASLSVAHA